MRTHPKLTSIRRLRQLVQAQSCAIDAEDPFQVHAAVSHGFSCHRCERRIPLHAQIYRRFHNVPDAAAQARVDGWVVQPSRQGYLPSEAFCPDCKSFA